MIRTANLIPESDHVSVSHAVARHHQPDQWIAQQVAEPCFTVNFCAHDDLLLYSMTNVGINVIQHFVRMVTLFCDAGLAGLRPPAAPRRLSRIARS
jgi:hypothetical protein